MASLSNKDRIGKGLDLLAEGLLPFVSPRMAAAAGAAGGDWVRLIAARDEAKHGKSMILSEDDPALLLRVLTEEWRVFSADLSRVEQSFASELRDVRNRYAHGQSFTADDTYRALDTMERLLTAVGGVDQAEQVRRFRADHQRATFEAETKKLVKSQEGSVSVAGQGLKPWREVLEPHTDVATGNFSASEFAADLHMVAFARDDQILGTEYTDSIEFFRRTFLTEGLRDLLDRAIRRMGGDANVSPIINLQTNFGGGKTHALLALWHLMSGIPMAKMPQEVQELVAGRVIPAEVSRVALVGTHLKPAGSTKDDGTRVNTIWGELAWQLGGAEAFARVAEADESRTNPGDLLRSLISDYGPCLILVDEWVAYARQLWGREDLAAGTFDTQFTFAQSLTEIVKTVPGALLVISIPASHDPEKDVGGGGSAIEVGGPNGQEALQRLQNVVRRVADQWRPASSQESFEIVRRRLFVEPSATATADIAAVARQFTQFYARHVGEFPREVSEPAYEARIKAAYPLHPELFDRLYEDWSTLERFQRTRGVLRLMSTVVHALWVAQDASPMILPANIPLSVATVASEITQYLPDSWKPIIDTDIDGLNSTPAQVDQDRPLLQARAVTRRLARSIFIGSAPTLRSAHRGVERQRIWLGAALPGDTVGNFGSALDLLAQRATYLYSEGNRYWYDTQPSVTRTAADYADGLREKPEEVWVEVVRRLRDTESRHRGGFAAVSVAPDSSAEIQDGEEVRLVILHPSQTYSKGSSGSAAITFATDAFERRGTAHRTNRNLLVLLAPDVKRMDELAESTRSYLAWKWVEDRQEELNLSPQQFKQVTSNVHRNNDDVTARIAQTYHWVLLPEQPDAARPSKIAVEKAEGANARLAERVTDKLARSGLLASSVAARAIRLDLDQKVRSVWDRGHVAVGELWGYYCKYPYLTRLRDRSVLVDGVLSTLTSLTWELEGFALADSYDETTGRYAGLVVPGGDAHFAQVTDGTLLVAPSAALTQSALEQEAERGDDEHQAEPGVETPPKKRDRPAATPHNTRFFGVYRVNPERYARDLTRVSQEVLQQLAAVDGSRLEVTIEVHARAPKGFPDDKVRVVLENARTLKFEQSAFEDE